MQAAYASPRSLRFEHAAVTAAFTHARLRLASALWATPLVLRSVWSFRQATIRVAAAKPNHQERSRRRSRWLVVLSRSVFVWRTHTERSRKLTVVR